MTEWAAKLAQQKKQQREAERLKTEKILSDRRMIKSSSDPQWLVIRGALKDCADDLNHEMGETCISVLSASHTEIQITDGVDRALGKVIFNPSEATLKVNFHGAELRLVVGSGDQFLWRSEASSSDYWTSVQVAQKAIAYAWQSVK